MRYFILIFLIIGNLYSQKIDPQLKPVVDEYIQTSEKYGVDVTSKIKKLKHIKYAPLEYGLLGRYIHNTVLINDLWNDDSLLVRMVVYHELGHVMGLVHLCEECPYIMAATINSVNAVLMNDSTWTRYKQVYYNSIIEQDKLIKTKIVKNGKNNRKTDRREGTELRFK